MRLVIQRVTSASVTVDCERIASINRGLLILVGIERDDRASDAKYLIKKLLSIQLWPDLETDSQPWLTSVVQRNCDILLVSQFTLYSTVSGTKPDFHYAMSPSLARQLYAQFVADVRSAYPQGRVECNQFGADSAVELVNDGPVTILLSTDDLDLTQENEKEESEVATVLSSNDLPSTFPPAPQLVGIELNPGPPRLETGRPMAMPTAATSPVARAPSARAPAVRASAASVSPSSYSAVAASSPSSSFVSSTSHPKRKQDAVTVPFAEDEENEEDEDENEEKEDGYAAAAVGVGDPAAQPSKRTKYEVHNASTIQPTASIFIIPYGSIDWSQHLPADWFGPITSFLDLPSLSYTLRTCQTWSKYANRITPRNDRTLVISLKRSIKLIRARSCPFIRSVLLEPKLDLIQFELIRYHFPYLTDLSASINIDQFSFLAGPDTDPALIAFPPLLRRVSLFLTINKPTENWGSYHFSSMNWDNLISIVNCVCDLPALTSLKLTNGHGFYAPWSSSFGPSHIPISVLKPLLKAKDTLTHLTLFDYQEPGKNSIFNTSHYNAEDNWSVEQVAVIRQLTKLTSLDIPIQSEQSIAALLASPVPYELKYFSLANFQINPAVHTVALPLMTEQLHGIKKWRCQQPIDSILQFHSASLEEIFYKFPRGGDINISVQTLSQCTRLHTLVLSQQSLTSDQLTDLFSHLPHLRRLALIGISLSDFSSLTRVPHLSETLHQLVIMQESWHGVWSHDFISHQLASLHALRTLTLAIVKSICMSSRSVLTEEQRHALTPTSPAYTMRQHWPYLQKFTYRNRAEEEEEDDEEAEQLSQWTGFEEVNYE